MHKSPGIYLTTEENPGKLQLENRLMKTVSPIIASNEVPYLQMRSVGAQRTSGRVKKGGKNEGSNKECPVVHGAMSYSEESFNLVLWSYQLLSRLLANDHLLRVSRWLRLSANDK